MALARALAPRPKVLLLDEPFGALDVRAREELRAWLRNLHDEVHVTTLFVTHDQREAFEVSDRLVVLNRGRLEQIGPPQELYERPASPFVTEFLGAVNHLRGRSESGIAVVGRGLTFSGGLVEDGPVSVYVRPHDVDLTLDPSGDDGWPATVVSLTPLGALQRVVVALDDGTSLAVELTQERGRELALTAGDSVHVRPRPTRVFSTEAIPEVVY